MVNPEQSADRVGADRDREILREYYLEKNLASTEGVLKVLSIVVSTASSALWLARGACGGAGGGAAGAAAAAALALLCALDALWLAAYAPLVCFYTDIVVSTAVAVWLLTAGVLSLVFCDAQRALDYVHGPLAVASAGLVMSSAAVAYAAVTRRWDAASRPSPRPPRPSRLEAQV